MPDTKITALTAIGANPIIPATFPIPMVDLTDTSMAASGTTKKVTVNQILGAGGTATLASATITGAATVGTTLGVTGVSTLTGAVGVGAAPLGKFDVYNTVSDTTVFIRSDTTKLGQIVFRDNADSGNQGIVRYDHANDRLSFVANGSENLFLFSTGDLSLIAGNVVVSNGKGIDFSATAGTGTSELLNDYEEGTWTPVVTAGTGTLTSVTGQTGAYTKVGRMVVVTGFFTVTTNGTGGSFLAVAGLPFTNGNLTNIAVGRIDGTTGEMFQGKLNPATNTVNLWKYDNSYPAADGAQFPMTLTYYV